MESPFSVVDLSHIKDWVGMVWLQPYVIVLLFIDIMPTTWCTHWKARGRRIHHIIFPQWIKSQTWNLHWYFHSNEIHRLQFFFNTIMSQFQNRLELKHSTTWTESYVLIIPWISEAQQLCPNKVIVSFFIIRRLLWRVNKVCNTVIHKIPSDWGSVPNSGGNMPKLGFPSTLFTL